MPKHTQLVANLSHPQSNLQLGKKWRSVRISSNLCVFTAQQTAQKSNALLSLSLSFSIPLSLYCQSNQQPATRSLRATGSSKSSGSCRSRSGQTEAASKATCTSSQIQSVRATWWPLDDAVCGCLSISLLPFPAPPAAAVCLRLLATFYIDSF